MSHSPAKQPQSPTAAPLVSVALVVYNGARDIRQAIDSVLAQRHVNFELVVVDDGSTDETWPLLQSYGDRLRAIHQPNGGLPVARNTALAHARGDFVALMDHDDICHPDRLATQWAVLQAHPEVGLVCSDFSAFNDSGPISDTYISHYYSQCGAAQGGVTARYPHQEQLDLSAVLLDPRVDPAAVTVLHGSAYRELARGNFVHPPTIMFRRALLEQTGVFDPAMGSACDWELVVRFARQAPLAYIAVPLLNYRISPTQMSRSNRLHGSLEALHVALQICERDPELLAQDPVRMREHLADMHASAAYANSEDRPGLALRQLARAWSRYAYRGPLSRPTLTKVLLPKLVLDSIRRARRGFVR